MEISSQIKDYILVVYPKGRIDGYGASELSRIIKERVNDSIRVLILDFSLAPYMSSAGIRVLLESKKNLERRKGSLILTGVGPFPEEVLKMTGLFGVFKIMPTLDSAYEHAKLYSIKNDSITENADKEFSYSIQPGLNEPAKLLVTGNLGKVLHASIKTDDVYAVRFRDCDYSIGLGALAEDSGNARSILGEMITLHGSMVYVPTDGHFIPDFFTPVDDTGAIRIFTGFNVALFGPFQNYLSFVSTDSKGVSISRIYETIFQHMPVTNDQLKGIIALAIIGITTGVRSSGIIQSPIPENKLPEGTTIMDPENFSQWNALINEPLYSGNTLVSFGIGIDLTHDLSSFDNESLSTLYYIHPANKGVQSMYLHNHGVIFRGVPYSTNETLNDNIRRVVKEGEFVDMRHLLDDTRFSRGLCGIAYISKISGLSEYHE